MCVLGVCVELGRLGLGWVGKSIACTSTANPSTKFKKSVLGGFESKLSSKEGGLLVAFRGTSYWNDAVYLSANSELSIAIDMCREC